MHSLEPNDKMTCRSNDFKKFQKRIRRTLNYRGSKNVMMSAQISRMLAAYFNQYFDFEMTEKLSDRGFVSPYNMLTAIVYIARIKREREQDFLRFNPSELYLSTLMLATKFLNDGSLDEFIWNDEWASASGLALPELNQLELQTLQALDWNVFVSEEIFNETLFAMENWVARDLYQQNGQLTYNDLFILSRNIGMQSTKELIQLTANLLLYALLAYAALFLLILTAMAASLPNFHQKPQMQLDLHRQSIQYVYEMVDSVLAQQQFPILPFPFSTFGNGDDSECLFGNWSIPVLPPWISAIEEQRNFSIY